MDDIWPESRMLCAELRDHFNNNHFSWNSVALNGIVYHCWSINHIVFTLMQARVLLGFKHIVHERFVAMCENGIDKDIAFILSLE